ncbi:MAG: hypothetical protein AAF593_16570 [Planctomycetota bacterium]
MCSAISSASTRPSRTALGGVSCTIGKSAKAVLTTNKTASTVENPQIEWETVGFMNDKPAVV